MELLRDRRAEFDEAGVQPVGISRDSPYTHIAWTQALDLNFGLLSDFNGEAVRGFGIGFEFRGFIRAMDTPAAGSAAAGRGTSNLTYGILAGVAIVGVIFAFSGSAAMPNNWYALFKAVHVLGAVIWVGGGVSIMIHAIRGQR